MELDERFFNLASITASTLRLVSSVLSSDTFNLNFEQLKNKYAEDIPSPAYLEQELIRKKTEFSDFQPQVLPTTARATLKYWNQKMYCNIFTLIEICCTIPATSCEFEHSESVLCRLNTYKRTSTVCNFQSMKSPVELNNLFSKFFGISPD